MAGPSYKANGGRRPGRAGPGETGVSLSHGGVGFEAWVRMPRMPRMPTCAGGGVVWQGFMDAAHVVRSPLLGFQAPCPLRRRRTPQ